MSENYENNEIQEELTVESAPIEETADQPTVEEPRRPLTRRYNKRGRRRGKYAYAAPVGFLVSLLSIVGVVAIVVNMIGYFQKKNDDTALKKELYYYLEPLLIYSPEPFGDAAKKGQDAFLNAAAYRVMMTEYIRVLRAGAEERPKYPVDENYRIAVPVKEVEAAYAALFGPKAKLSHHTIESEGVEYSEGDQCYYIPFEEEITSHEIVIDKVKQYKDRYEVRVGFVPVDAIKLDEHGERIDPTVEQATHFQTYTLTRTKTGYYIKSCKNVDK